MQPVFELGQSGSKFHALKSESTLVFPQSIKGNIFGPDDGGSGAEPSLRYLQELDSKLGQVQGLACHMTPHRPAVHKAQLMPKNLHAQLTLQRPPLPMPLGHL